MRHLGNGAFNPGGRGSRDLDVPPTRFFRNSLGLKPSRVKNWVKAGALQPTAEFGHLPDVEVGVEQRFARVLQPGVRPSPGWVTGPFPEKLELE
ncbi:MAG: hypothetical protein U1F77_04295 [Kiritimatiellia bacterium]